MYKLFFISLILLLAGCSGDSSPTNNDAPDDGWQLVWNDEFDSERLLISRWNYEIGGHGWGNNESQYYTDRPENSFLSDGYLHIRALKESYEGSDYTSARLTTRNKGDWLYGKFEVRARLPYGQGLWPAIWMLPTDWEYGGWAASGEIDIMELIGNNPGTVVGTLHYGGESPQNVHSGGSFTLPAEARFADDFHVFSLVWTADSISWYVDNEHYLTQKQWYSSNGVYPAPFNKRFHILLNVAVGGNWPGYPDASTVFPQEMVVDYVRVYEYQDEQ